MTSYERPEQLIEHLEQSIEAGEKVFVALDSQKAKSRFGTIALEKRLNEKYPDKRILRIDSDTLKQKNSRAFNCIESLNTMIVDYDIVLASPSIGSGVSIDVEHFDRVFALLQGVSSENAARQALARVRAPSPREGLHCTTRAESYR